MPSFTSRRSNKRSNKMIAEAKNSRTIEKYLTMLDKALHNKSAEIIYTTERLHNVTLARVIKPLGANDLSVVYFTGGDEKRVHIARGVTSRGSSATKTDQVNSMHGGSIIVVDGGLASGKFSKGDLSTLRHAFDTLGVRVPEGFFADSSAAIIGSGSFAVADDGFDFDYSDEAAADAMERAAAAEARKSKAPKMRDIADVDVLVAAESDKDLAALAGDDEDVAVPVAVPVAVVAVPVASKMSRAERRAAAQAAEVAEAEHKELLARQARLRLEHEDAPVARPVATWAA
jgi:hypothetical protein